jgi:hypothetical protein
MSFSCTGRPVGSKHEKSKCLWYSTSMLSAPLRFFSTEATIQSRKRCAWYGLNSMLTFATIWYF